MADCDSRHVRAYKSATSIEDRAYLGHAFQHIFTEHGHLPPNDYTEIFNWFMKPGVKDLKQDLIMTKPGLAAIAYPQILLQGHHVAPMYHPHATQSTWKAYNPIHIQVKFSKYGGDAPQFQTEEQIKMAIRNDAWAFQTSFSYWQQKVISYMFMTADEWKKLGASKTDTSDGINNEFDAIYNPTTGDTDGYPSHHVGLSIEQTFLAWKDGKPMEIGKTDSEAKPYKVTVNKEKLTTDALYECIHKNTITATASTLKGFKNQSDDYVKWMGLVQKIKTVVLDMKKTNTSKYNICFNATNPGECVTNKDKLVAAGIKLGCCTTCTNDGKECCCCYNQAYAQAEDLALFMNVQDVLTIMEAFPLINHPERLETLAQNFGVSRIFLINEVKSGEVLIINRKTIGIHPIADGKTVGTAYYEEFSLHNIWWDFKAHFVIWPSHCVKIIKPT